MKRILSLIEQAELESLLLKHDIIRSCIQDIHNAGGKVFLVGGAVRDLIMQLPVKDLDFEVHGISLEDLKKILEQHGTVNAVGKSFGVLKFRAREQGPEIDWSLPRSDSSGRKPEVTIDPHMTLEQALRRRDVTMNAMALDCTTFELHDPFGGLQDIQNKVLRCTDTRLFVEDPLRFYRVMQFIGRFEMNPDEELNQICATMDVSTISRERIEEEMKKLMLQSREPSRGFRWVAKIGRLQELFPELHNLGKTPQSQKYHPEGSVFEHTMQVIDAAAQLRDQCVGEEQKLILMYAALCHDLGKAATTQERADGRITSYEHELVGAEMVPSFLTRFCGDKSIIKSVRKLVRHHMDPGNFLKNRAGNAAYKKLALRLMPETNCAMLALLFEADRRGRNGQGHRPLSGPLEGVQEFQEKVSSLGVLKAPEAPVLIGADLLDAVEPGPRLGDLVKKAYDIQINENIHDKVELRKRVLNT